MFERFSGTAKHVVVTAQQAARDAGVGEVDNADLLVALVRAEDATIGRLLAGHDLTADGLVEEFTRARRRGGMSEADVTALSVLGVDVDNIVRSVEQTLGEQALAPPSPRRRFLQPRSHIPFSDEAKRTLMRSLREATERDTKQIGAEHLLLALLTGKTIATDALEARGVTYQGISAQLAKVP